MSNCACGVERRQFWLWRDGSDEQHASRFRPTSGAVRSVWAVNARDALLPVIGGAPKHEVTDVDDFSALGEGRCATSAAAAAAG